LGRTERKKARVYLDEIRALDGVLLEGRGVQLERRNEVAHFVDRVVGKLGCSKGGEKKGRRSKVGIVAARGKKKKKGNRENKKVI